MQLLSWRSTVLSLVLLSGVVLAAGGCGGGGGSAIRAPSFTPSSGSIYVLTNNSEIQMYAPNAGSSAAPLDRFTSGVLTNPTGIAVDGQGTVYVAQAPNIYAFTYANYANAVTGSVSPSMTLTSVAGPWGLTISPTGSLVATDSVNNSVDFFLPGSSRNAAAYETLSGGNTLIDSPYQAAFDGAGNLYVLNTAGNNGYGSVTVYAASAVSNNTGNVNVAPIAVITSNATAFSQPRALAVDAGGNVYVGNNTNDDIAVFGPGSNGYVSPMAVVSGYSMFCTCQATMTAMSNSLYVAGWNRDDILVYASISSSSATPVQTITSASLGQTEGVSVVP